MQLRQLIEVNGQIQSPATLPTKKNLGAHLMGSWAGQSRSGRFGEEKHLLPVTRIEPWTVQPVAR